MAIRFLHHPLYVIPTFPNDVGVFGVGYLHLESDSQTLHFRETKRKHNKHKRIELEVKRSVDYNIFSLIYNLIHHRMFTSKV